MGNYSDTALSNAAAYSSGTTSCSTFTSAHSTNLSSAFELAILGVSERHSAWINATVELSTPIGASEMLYLNAVSFVMAVFK